MTRSGWLIAVAAVLAVASAALHFWNVQKPPVPSAAALPASARMRLQPSGLQPFRKDGLDLKLDAHGELQYRIAMQAGATLVYSWKADRGVSLVSIRRIRIRGLRHGCARRFRRPIVRLVPLALE